jgi:hypothetical protein
MPRNKRWKPSITKQTPKTPSSRWKSIINILAAIFTIITGIILIWQVFFPYLFRSHEKPVIQASGFRVFFIPGDTLRQLHAKYVVTNVGRQDVVLTTTVNGLFWNLEVAEDPFADPAFSPVENKINVVLTKEKPTADSLEFTGNQPMSDKSVTATQTGELILYMAGKIFYESGGIKYAYNFKVKFQPPKMEGYNFITNKNTKLE